MNFERKTPLTLGEVLERQRIVQLWREANGYDANDPVDLIGSEQEWDFWLKLLREKGLDKEGRNN